MQIPLCFIFPSAQSIILPEFCDGSLVGVRRLCTHTLSRPQRRDLSVRTHKRADVDGMHGWAWLNCLDVNAVHMYSLSSNWILPSGKWGRDFFYQYEQVDILDDIHFKVREFIKIKRLGER